MTTGTATPYRFADVRLWSTALLPEVAIDQQAIDTGADWAPGEDLFVSWETLPRLDTVDWFHRWGDQTDWLRFGQVGHTYVLEFPEFVRFTFDEAARRIGVSVNAGVPDVTARHLLLNQVLPLALSRLGRFVLHAAALVVEDEVVALVGPTGSGKSTLVAACGRLGAPIVADDSLVLKREGGAWVAVPAYPAVRLWPDALDRLDWPAGSGEVAAHYLDKRRLSPTDGIWVFEQRELPLRQIWMLEPAGTAPRPVALDLFSQVFRMDVRDRAESARLFHLVADLAGSVPVGVLDGGVEHRDVQATAARLCGVGAPGRVAPPDLFRA